VHKVNVFTIGFTQTTARSFFERLKKAGVKKVFDVRLHNVSQLSGFAKSNDLAYFLSTIASIGYVHQPILAPTDHMLKDFKKRKGDWDVYQRRFVSLMMEREIEKKFNPDTLDGVCLLCSEATPHYCHRRLVVEYLNEKWNRSFNVIHL